MLVFLVLKNAVECTSQRLKWTSGARVMTGTCPKNVRNKSGPRGQMKIKQNVDHHKAKRQGQRQQGQRQGQQQAQRHLLYS